MTTAHVIEVDIDAEGKVHATVKGVSGAECGPLSKWLDELGKVEIDDPTGDMAKTSNVRVGQKTSR